MGAPSSGCEAHPCSFVMQKLWSWEELKLHTIFLSHSKATRNVVSHHRRSVHPSDAGHLNYDVLQPQDSRDKLRSPLPDLIIHCDWFLGNSAVCSAPGSWIFSGGTNQSIASHILMGWSYDFCTFEKAVELFILQWFPLSNVLPSLKYLLPLTSRKNS